MRVVIVGAGQVGFHIADRLSREGHHVALIEKSSGKEAHLRTRLNALVVRGTGASAEVLEQADIGHADLFIAVTDQDEVNLVSCMLANDYDVPRIICRFRSLEYTQEEWTENAKKLGIDLLINPQTVVARDICEIVSYPAATEAAEFADGRILFLGYLIDHDNPLAGVSLRELGDLRGMYRMVVTAISRRQETVIPRGDDVIRAGDILYFVCRREDLAAINYLFGFDKRRARNIMILGGGRVGAEVAGMLARDGYRVKVIDRNLERCRSLAEELEGVSIIHAEAIDMETLRDEGLEQTDVCIALTDGDERNILYSLLAKSRGARRAIAMVNEPQFVSLAPSLGVDACISPRLATAGAILRFVRRGEVLSMAMVEECEAEVMELILPADCRIRGQALRDIRMPRGSIIAAIVRGEEVIIPGGDDTVEQGDHLVVFSLPDAVKRVEGLFS